MEEKIDPRNGTAQEQMDFIEWFSDNYPDFWDKVVKEYNEGLEE